MKFIETDLSKAYLVELEKKEDDRGFFARVFDVNEFKMMGLDSDIVQINNSMGVYKGTLRGMHYQLEPKAETKIVRCIRGSLYDVIVDLRKTSPTYLKWFGAELTSGNRRMMVVPRGFAHGFITLEDNTEALYLTTEFYSPENERGVRYNDPKINIQWAITPKHISDKDLNHPDFNEPYHLGE